MNNVREHTVDYVLCILHDTKQYKYISERDTCIVEGPVWTAMDLGLLLSMVMIGIPDSRAKVMALNSKNKGE